MMETNPYARAAGQGPAAPAPGGPAVPPLPPEEQKLHDYSVAVAKNTDYFLPRFDHFDNGGSRVGWNWPAFFITGPYFLYRKMWLPGFLYIFYPWILMIPLGIVAALIPTSAAVIVGIGFLLYFASWILLPMYANSLYWSKIKGLIDDLPRSIATQPDKRERRLERNGGTSLVVPLIVFLFGGVFGVGMLAAISLPAYHDYSIRSQVSEGLNLARGAKATVAEYHAQHNAWPASNVEAHYSSADGEYTEPIQIDQGSIIITYGRAANQKLKGGRIALVPGIDASGDVVWVCGDGPTPDGVTLSEGPRGIEVEEKYLPRNCRGTPGAGN
jgi:type IV pilus assembly protein PilA